MFSAFLDQEDYTLDAVIKEIEEEIADNRFVKASLGYIQYCSRLDQIRDALEQVRENERRGVK